MDQKSTAGERDAEMDVAIDGPIVVDARTRGVEAADIHEGAVRNATRRPCVG